MPELSPRPELVARFRRDVGRLVGEPELLGLAVSGGPDSLALLLLAAAAFPGRVAAATVDHGLRAESADEARHVASVCAGLDCPHAILAIAVPDGPGGVQAEARKARYGALRAWAEDAGIDHIATAHHADDQAETILMRLQRGSGVGGLSAIRPVRSEGASLAVIRPLLGWTREELGSLVAEAGVAAVDDPSNRDRRFDRVVIRQFLTENPAFQPARLARSAAALREADEALGWTAAQLADDRCTSQGGEWRIDPDGLPRELRRRLLVRAVAAVREAHGLDPAQAGSEDVETLLSALEDGGGATLGGTMANARGGVWIIRLAPPRQPR